MPYFPIIGLEIHIELNTKTKMFCACENNPFFAEPNTNICPICLGHPGALPTINMEAIKSTIKLGLALNGHIAEHSNFDRKSYFYPDLPKGYQISQYKHPLVEGGSLNNIRITRIHLEEDAGALLHANSKFSFDPELRTEGQIPNSKNEYSLINFNRAGVPLVELVTEPDIKSGKEAMDFARELQLILRYLHIANADMEKGEMRVEANISVSKEKGKLGTKVEVKNLNSFKIVGDAIEYELKRQEELLEQGEKVIPETRGWNEKEEISVSQRSKEEARDYRYFPEPDLPPLDFTNNPDINIELLRRELPELPEGKRARLMAEYDLDKKQAEVLVSDLRAAEFYEQSVSECKTEDAKKCSLLAYNYLTSDLFGIMKDRDMTFDTIKINPENFADLVALVEKGELSSRMAKDILLLMSEGGEDPREIMKREGIAQVSDTESITRAVREVIAENEKAVSDFKKGNENSFKFLVGQTMKKMKGQGNPELIQGALKQELTLIRIFIDKI
ncbi:MAG: Asp-tRNA(Asn)/Glu-tRNA(Gln) amidotransferase subunit GatB [Nanoarchaeota archaeon]|nr:Asp-tRNA(Asn)/Glu-tRNA(Gln) amidotransferase subunit GatB [Nanoarchaeota archaeon]